MENEFRLNKKSTSFTTDAFKYEKNIISFLLQELLLLLLELLSMRNFT
jgi:hypothetical protein